ncbi:MAG: hypothetical protein JOZ38_00355 [Candidatus Eremiobacteraeota bacterium]|nr:hypothetical protein [Candidatus Eremiobacteraeota bacterium]
MTMSVVRGRGRGLELNFAETPFAEALADLRAQLAERGEFYRGSAATVVLGTEAISEEHFDGLVALLGEFDVRLESLSGPDPCAPLAAAAGLPFVPVRLEADGDELRRRRAARPKREISLSPSARSLAADFAGARADLARRRTEKTTVRPFAAPPHVTVRLAEPAVVTDVATLYHVGTVRGGQSLHHIGNIVLVGDVNPGAELVASGDIVVFGGLRGVAHAGAQGDDGAKVFAIDLAPTQLRIATTIAAEAEPRAGPARPEVAWVSDGRIAIAPYDTFPQLVARGRTE